MSILKVIMDPLEYYKSSALGYESLGLIPSFVSTKKENESLKDTLTEAYGYGELYKIEATIADKLFISDYSEDPTLYPIAEMKIHDATLIQYHYGIVAIQEVEGGDYFVTRMD